MIIELFGESGCGKTTFIKHLTAHNSNIVRPESCNSFKIICQGIRNVKYKEFRKLFRLLFWEGIKSYKVERIFKNTLYVLKLCNYYAKDKYGMHEQIYVLDQGCIQFLHTVSYTSGKCSQKLASILEYIFSNYNVLAVYCYCDYDILVERVRKRARGSVAESKRRIEDIVNDKEIVAFREQIFSKLIQNISKENMCRVDTGVSGEDLSKVVLKAINDRGR